MKNKDLIEKLQQFSPDLEVCIYDWRKNIVTDWGDGSSTGIYPAFEIGQVNEAEQKEQEYEEPKILPFIALGFSNEEYEPMEERTCRVCGCTEDNCRQCIEKTGHPCHWVEEDLCSACKT